MKTIVGQKLKIRLESKDPQNARPPIVCPELDVTFCSVMILKKPGPPRGGVVVPIGPYYQKVRPIEKRHVQGICTVRRWKGCEA
jgi:hypothetical protein